MTSRELETAGAWAVFAACAFWLLCYCLVRALAWIEERDRRRAAADAAVFGEPTREQVETGYLDEDDETWRYLAPLEYICRRCTRIVDQLDEPSAGAPTYCPDCAGQVAREDGAA